MITASDLLSGAITKWNSDGLNSSIGPLLSGRLSAPVAPYAVVRAEHKRNQFYSEGLPGQVYVSVWLLVITVYATGAVAADALGKLAGNDFDVQTLAVTGATLLSCFPEDGWPKLTEDPARPAGEDWWQAEVAWEVVLSGLA
jgi:hypothetical protein